MQEMKRVGKHQVNTDAIIYITEESPDRTAVHFMGGGTLILNKTESAALLGADAGGGAGNGEQGGEQGGGADNTQTSTQAPGSNAPPAT